MATQVDSIVSEVVPEPEPQAPCEEPSWQRAESLRWLRERLEAIGKRTSAYGLDD